MRSLARLLVASLVLAAPLACEKPAAQPATEEPSEPDSGPTETPETEPETSAGEPTCDFTADPTKRYVGESPDKCAVMRFVCEEGTEYFADDCGCGCVTIAAGG